MIVLNVIGFCFGIGILGATVAGGIYWMFVEKPRRDSEVLAMISRSQFGGLTPNPYVANFHTTIIPEEESKD